MFPHGRFSSLLTRAGERVEILTKKQTGTNDFNNPEHEWETQRVVNCAVIKSQDSARSEMVSGERQIDTVSLYFPIDVDLPSNFRIKRLETGGVFEVETTTTRRSYTEASATKAD